MHHIDGKGHDSGVVYSEMQGRENTPGDLMALRFIIIKYMSFSHIQIYRLQRLLDPPGSGYRSETGGLMEALRVLTPEQSGQNVFSVFPLIRPQFAGIMPATMFHITWPSL